jgi:hypothetical protein
MFSPKREGEKCYATLSGLFARFRDPIRISFLPKSILRELRIW